jgi:hypothetical protein
MEADQRLHEFVNYLGVAVFIAIILYHLLQAIIRRQKQE